MALAQRLNELAVANSDGLLNDDEYRLLRQGIFEQYSTSLVIPVEPPVVPIARVHVQLRGTTTSPSPAHRRPPEKASHKPAPIPARPPPKSSSGGVTSGVAYLLRRATGRKTPTHAHDPPTTKDPRKTSAPVSTDTPKRSALHLPRLLHKKRSIPELPARPEASRAPDPPRTPRLVTDAPLSPRSTRSTSSKHHHPSTSSAGPSSVPPIPTLPDVFDESNLLSARDIRATIAITEDEARRLVDAFHALEASTLRRLHKQSARRLPAPPPASVDVLLEGREWREHRLTASSSSPLFGGAGGGAGAEPRSRRILNALEGNYRNNGTGSGTDATSIRSGSSNRTTLSGSKSISSLPKLFSHSSSSSSSPPSTANPLSPLSPSYNPPRKGSISSLSSQATSFKTSTSPPSSLSRSTSHLPLRALKLKHSAGASTDTVGLRSLGPSSPTTSAEGSSTGDPELDNDPEVMDIRRRREDLVARYTARLEFLRAKLKGAELREKLLRK